MVSGWRGAEATPMHVSQRPGSDRGTKIFSTLSDRRGMLGAAVDHAVTSRSRQEAKRMARLLFVTWDGGGNLPPALG